MSALGLYLHTVRYLRPVQVAGRARMKLLRPRPDLREAPPSRAPSRSYVEPTSAAPTLIAPETFRFLNVERRCALPDDWLPSDVSKLWVYNLHYFDDLNALSSRARVDWHRALLGRWVTENPPGRTDGWEPYPVSRRVVNWVKWAARGNTLPAACHSSLAVQTRWLARRLEYHLLGNHLLTNAKALLHAGLFFDGPEAEGWRRKGLAIIDRELHEQVLADGGHFELSPMYHAAALEDMLDLINLLRAYGEKTPSVWSDCVHRMLRWLRTMSHPDGRIAFFNDAAFDVAPTLRELEDYAQRLGIVHPAENEPPLLMLESSGYARAVAGSACLICDCAAVGPDYLPAHAHADTLSFELSLGGQRVFVNSGTSQYGADAERQRQRGTAAHNTVVVDDRDSTEVWGGFRVARRARVRGRTATSNAGVATIEATHDGYRRFGRHNDHTRRWCLDAQSLAIEDRVTGSFARAQARFHLHPGIAVKTADERSLTLSTASGPVTVAFEGSSSVNVEQSTWHPQFGVSIANRCIVARFENRPLIARVHWAA